MIAKERDYVAVMSVRFPVLGVVLWHITCPKFGSTLPEASHLTRLWPGIINRQPALVSQEFDSRPSAFSEVLTKWLFVMHRVVAMPCTLTHRPFLFSQWSRVSSQGFCSCPSVPY